MQPCLTVLGSVRWRERVERRVCVVKVWPRRWQELGDKEDLERSNERRVGRPAAGNVGRWERRI